MGHLFADPVDVERSAAHAAVLLGDEEQLHTEGVAAHAADDVLRAHVLVIELQLFVRRKRIGDELTNCLDRHLEGLRVETRSERSRLPNRHCAPPGVSSTLSGGGPG
jgi:hypothetical protein